MKKKIYTAPEVHIVKVHCETIIAYSKFDEEVSAGTGGWSKDSGDWDIWGSDDGDDY